MLNVPTSARKPGSVAPSNGNISIKRVRENAAKLRALAGEMLVSHCRYVALKQPDIFYATHALGLQREVVADY